MAGTFEVYADKAGEHRFRLKASNGETVLASEGYSAKSGATDGIESVKANAGTASQFELFQGKDGKHRFNLKAKNHQVIGTSQSYDSADGAKNGIAAVGRAAAGAKTVEV